MWRPAPPTTTCPTPSRSPPPAPRPVADLETAPFAATGTTSLADVDTPALLPGLRAGTLGAARRADPGRGGTSPPAPIGPASRRRPDDRGHALLRGALRLRVERGPDARAPGVGLVDLGAEVPPVRRRWEGVYARCVDGAVCLREEIHPGVWTVTGPGGRGMTCAPAIAVDTLRVAGAMGAAVCRPSPSPVSIWRARPCATMARWRLRSRTALAAVGIVEGSPRASTRPRRWCTGPWAGPRPTCSPACSSRREAQEATAAFAAAYEAIVATGAVTAIPGVLRGAA